MAFRVVLWVLLSAVPAFAVKRGCSGSVAASGDQRMTAEQVDLSRLGPDLKNLVRALLDGRADCWSRVYALRIKLAEGAEETAREHKLKPIGGSLYQAAWSLEKIALATKYPGVLSIFSDPAANRARWPADN